MICAVLLLSDGNVRYLDSVREKKMPYKVVAVAFVAVMAWQNVGRGDCTTPTLLNEDCTLPTSWGGSWFHSGFPHPLNITDRAIDNKGTCINHIGNRYIMAEQ